MRIAFFSDNFDPEMSGITDSIISLGKALAERRHEIMYVVPKYSDANYKLVGREAREIDLGKNIRVFRLPALPYPTGTRQGRLALPFGSSHEALKKFDPDVLHTQLFFGAGLEALIEKKWLKKPLIGTNHTAIKEFVKYSPVKAKFVEDGILKYVNWYYGKCNFLTAPSRSVLDEMNFYGFSKEGHVISNPIDTMTFCPLPNKNWLRKKFGFGEQTIIHAGRLASERSINVILKAMPAVLKEFPKAELALAGKGAAEEALRLLTEHLNISHAVHFLGFLDKPVLAEAYNASQIFVITSTADTQSMVMMQAMASGLPVIGVKARALPEYIKKENGILIEPADHEALAKKIIYLLKNPEERKRLGQGGRRLTNQFSIDSITSQWEKIYETVIDRYR